MVALAASAMCARVDCVTVLESLAMSGYANEQMFRATGIDRALDDPEVPSMVEAACGSFEEQVRVMARALGAELDEVAFDIELGAADRTTDFGFLTFRRGHVAGFKGTVAGLVGGRPLVRCRFVWKVGHEMTPNWPVEEGYVLEIEGEPSVRSRLEAIGPQFDGAVTTSMPVVDAIPKVCEAPPGIVNHVGLPFVTGVFSGRG